MSKNITNKYFSYIQKQVKFIQYDQQIKNTKKHFNKISFKPNNNSPSSINIKYKRYKLAKC